MKKLMLMSAVAGAILITSATTSCKKGDQGPAGTAGKDAKNVDVKTGGDAKIKAEVEVLSASRLPMNSAITNTTKEEVDKWVTKEQVDVLIENSNSKYFTNDQKHYNDVKNQASKYVSGKEFKEAQTEIKKSVVSGLKKSRIEAAEKMTNTSGLSNEEFEIQKGEAIEEANSLVEISPERMKRLTSLIDENKDAVNAKNAKKIAEKIVLDDNNGTKRTEAINKSFTTKATVVNGIKVTNEIKEHTLNYLKLKAAEANLEALTAASKVEAKKEETKTK